MEKTINFIAGKKMFQRLLAGVPDQKMLDDEIKCAKKLIHNKWLGAKADEHTFINAKLKGKQDDKYITSSHIACAKVSKWEPTSKNPAMMGSTVFVIWVKS